MYLRKSTRKYKDKVYTSYVLVESVMTPKGPRQKTICTLGSLEPRPAEAWLRLAHKIEEALVGQLSFEEETAEVREIVEQVRARQAAQAGGQAEELVSVRVDEVEVEEVREAGAVPQSGTLAKHGYSREGRPDPAGRDGRGGAGGRSGGLSESARGVSGEPSRWDHRGSDA